MINCKFGTFGNLAYKACNETCGSDYQNFLENSSSIFLKLFMFLKNVQAIAR